MWCLWGGDSDCVCCVQGSYVEAVTQMRGCLQSLGRPLPTTNLDLIASLFWGLLRQLLHRSGFCRLMEWKAASLWRALSDHDIKLSARDASVIYHKLLQLHLTGLYLSSTTNCSNFTSQVCTCHLPQTAPSSPHRSIVVTVVYHKLLQLHLTGLYWGVWAWRFRA